MNFRLMQYVAIHLCICLILTSCMLGHEYSRPPVNSPEGFKEDKSWKPAEPRDNILSVKWWEIFNDPKLNELEEQVATANQSIIKAEAQFRQAEHMVLTAEAALFPSSTVNGTTSRFVAASGGASAPVAGIRNQFGNSISGTWQLDLWGGVRRQIETNISNAQASGATMQALILSSQSALAADYFQLKILDEQKKLLDETVETFSKTLQITKNRYAAGIAAKTDVAQAEAQTESARAQAIDLGVLRAQYEHAIAVLIGKAPADLTLPASPLAAEIPAIPVSLPSELLERRPDIAVAERQMAATNALIGVAKAAYFPTLNLAGTDGFQSGFLSTLYNSARNYWTLGPASAAMVWFDGGAKNAQYKQAKDNYDASVANYKQTILTAFQQVEDNLAALRILEDEIKVQKRAVDAANEALNLTLNQYQAGTVSYINVLTAQSTALTNRVTALQLKGSRLTASVQLVTALGGGWNMSMVPNSEQIGGEIKWSDYVNIPFVDQGSHENKLSNLDDFFTFKFLP